jgi:hypothetical protein
MAVGPDVFGSGALVLGLAAALLQACSPTVARPGAGGAVHLNPSSMDGLGQALGRSVDDVEIPQTTLDDLAARAEVPPGQVAETAQTAAEPEVVSRTAQTLDSHWGTAGEEVAKDATISLACDALRGEELTWDDYAMAIGEAYASGNPTYRMQQLNEAVVDLDADWRQALAGQDREERVAVLLICFAFENS